jgi:hypothetical protein
LKKNAICSEELFDIFKLGLHATGVLLCDCFIAGSNSVLSYNYNALQFRFGRRVALIGYRSVTLLGARIHVSFVKASTLRTYQAIHCVVQVHVHLSEIGRNGSEASMLRRCDDLGRGISMGCHGKRAQPTKRGSDCYSIQHMSLL